MLSRPFETAAHDPAGRAALAQLVDSDFEWVSADLIEDLRVQNAR